MVDAAASGDEEAKGREGAGTPPVRRVGIRCRVDECVRSTLLLVQVASVGVDETPGCQILVQNRHEHVEQGE